MKKTQGFKKVK